MRTIIKILGYEPKTDAQIAYLQLADLFNGTGTKEINFDKLIQDILDILVNAGKFDPVKAIQLKLDIIQLVLRHDIETAFKTGFTRSNFRLANGIYKLLHKFPIYYRVSVWLIVITAVFSKTAWLNYKKLK